MERLGRDDLRRWQVEALDEWLTHGSRGIVEVATGGGKTRFALACAAALKSPVPTVLVVVPTAALADQWVVSIAEDGGVSPEQVATLTSRSTYAEVRQFNVVILNTARNLNANLWHQRHVFLIVDECHRAASPENAQSLQGQWCATLGLSATPARQYDDGLTEILIPRLGPVIYKYTVRDALRDGILSKFNLTNVRVELSSDEAEEYHRLSRKIAQMSARGASSEEIFKIARLRARVSAESWARIPVAVHLVERNHGARQIVFHESVAHADKVLSVLLSRGHSASIYHSQLGSQMRRENLRLFRRGIYDTLVTCRALDEGVNVPEAQIAIIAASTASDRQRIQRLGRVLRPAPEKSEAHIFSIYATEVEADPLRAEQQELLGMAQVSWLNASGL